MKKIFPVDVDSVKAYGVENWVESCPDWPVSDAEYLSLSKAIDQLYFNTILEASPELKDVLLATYKLTADYIASIHAAMVVDRLARQGFSISYDRRAFSTGNYDPLIRNTNDFRGSFQNYPSSWPRIPSFQRRIRGWLYVLRRNYKHSDSRSTFRPSSQDCLVLSQPEDELVWYAESRGKQIRYIYPFSLITERRSQQNHNLPNFDRTVLQLTSGLEDIAQKFGIQLRTIHIAYFRDLTSLLLIEMEKAIVDSRRYFRRIDQTDILISKLGGTLARIACAAGKREGFNIVGLTHGDTLGLRRTYNHAFDLFTVDTYLVPTAEAVRLWYKSWDKYFPSGETRVEIISYDTEVYRNLWEENSKRPLPSSIRNVLFLEFPLTEFRYPNILAFWPYQLDFIIRLATCIRKQGIRLIIKRHPDRLNASDGIYDRYFDELIVEPFEIVYEKAHAFLFPNISTTTLYFALLTNRPVILFDFQLQDMWEEVREPLRKRCRVVPSWFGDDGKVMFDEDALAEALSKKPEKPDEMFLRQYMFP